jgi:hypothetical protein
LEQVVVCGGSDYAHCFALVDDRWVGADGAAVGSLEQLKAKCAKLQPLLFFFDLPPK